MLDCESVHATWTVNLGAEILKATRKSPPTTMDLKGPRVRIEGLEIKGLKACVQGGRVFGDSRFEEGFKVPIVSILVPFFGLTKYIIRIL